jgi:hypothetical protein
MEKLIAAVDGRISRVPRLLMRFALLRFTLAPLGAAKM